MLTRWAGAAVAVAALVLGPGYSLAAPPESPSGYTIGAEDILDVTVWNNTGISRTVPVRPDGKISLPLLDDVQAAGLTPRQLKADLTRRLAKYIGSPEVSVVVREIHSLKVAVIGEVRKPGRRDRARRRVQRFRSSLEDDDRPRRGFDGDPDSLRLQQGRFRGSDRGVFPPARRHASRALRWRWPRESRRATPRSRERW